MNKETQTICSVYIPETNSKCKGILWKSDVSKLQESLGHRVYKCDSCGSSFVFVPKQE